MSDYTDLRRKVYGTLLIVGPATIETLATVTGYPASDILDSEVLVDLQRSGLVVGDCDTDIFKALMPDDYAALDRITLLDMAGSIMQALRYDAIPGQQRGTVIPFEPPPGYSAL